MYYRKAKEDGFRARSAYKLMHVDEMYNVFDGVQRVIDICAAPGSWSQLIVKKLAAKGFEYVLFISVKSEPRVVSVDLQKIAPIEGVITIQGDITKEETVKQILDNFGGNKAELVVCDGAPDGTKKLISYWIP